MGDIVFEKTLNTGSLSELTTRLTADTMSQLMEVLRDLRFETDYVLADYGEGTSVVFDENNLLTKDFTFDTIRISDATNAQNISEIVNTLSPGGVAIYEDLIEDTFAFGGESTDGEFKIYAPISRHAPLVTNPEIIVSNVYSTFDSESFVIDELFDPTDFPGFVREIKYNYSYPSLERTNLHTKYSCIQNLNSIDEAPFKALDYVQDIVADLSLEVYNTVVSRHFAPQRIKQKPAIQQIATETTLGEENQTADGLSIALSSTGY